MIIRNADDTKMKARTFDAGKTYLQRPNTPLPWPPLLFRRRMAHSVTFANRYECVVEIGLRVHAP
jgi:hypothetical protein